MLELTLALNSKLKSKGLSSFEEELFLVVVSVMLQWLNLLLQLVILKGIDDLICKPEIETHLENKCMNCDGVG